MNLRTSCSTCAGPGAAEPPDVLYRLKILPDPPGQGGNQLRAEKDRATSMLLPGHREFRAALRGQVRWPSS
jgi:hypothetical protein